MPQIISFIANVMVRETLLPYRPILLAEPIRESTLDHLQRTLKRNILRGREQQMQMVGHDETNSCNTNLPCSAWCLSTSTMSCEACWRKIGVRFHVTVVTKNVLSKFIPEPYRPAHTKSVILEQKSMARSRMDRFCSKAAASTWKSGSLEPRQHVPLIAGFSPG